MSFCSVLVVVRGINSSLFKLLSTGSSALLDWKHHFKLFMIWLFSKSCMFSAMIFTPFHFQVRWRCSINIHECSHSSIRRICFHLENANRLRDPQRPGLSGLNFLGPKSSPKRNKVFMEKTPKNCNYHKIYFSQRKFFEGFSNEIINYLFLF